MSVSVETKRRFRITRLEERIAPSGVAAKFEKKSQSHRSSHKSHRSHKSKK